MILSGATTLGQNGPENGNKRYSAFPKAPSLLELHQQIVLCHIKDPVGGVLTPLQRCFQCIRQPQPTGL